MARRFVSFSENVGHQMTYIILTEETNKIIYRSRVKLAALQPNKGLEWDPGGPENDHHNNNEASSIEPNDNDDMTQFIRGGNELRYSEDESRYLPVIDPAMMIGRTY